MRVLGLPRRLSARCKLGDTDATRVLGEKYLQVHRLVSSGSACLEGNASEQVFGEVAGTWSRDDGADIPALIIGEYPALAQAIQQVALGPPGHHVLARTVKHHSAN